jgi:hypothetical protein
MLENVLTWVIVFFIGGALTCAAVMIFMYCLWAMQEDETDRSHTDVDKQDKGNSR